MRLNEAIGWAWKVLLRSGSAIEVRQIMDLSPFGYEGVTPGPVQAKV